jgi:amino acid adenylation domain-containing protein
MALAVKQPRSYIARHVFKIPLNIEIPRFKHAWNQTVAACSNLRTRIVFIDGQSVQLVLQDNIQWTSDSEGTLHSISELVHNVDMTYGSPLCRYGLANNPDGHTYFVFSIHHSISDGWTMGLIWQQFYCFYHEADAPILQPYSRFIKYLSESDREISKQYWVAQLNNASKTAFPRQQRNVSDVIQNNKIKTSTMTLSFQTATTSITKATMLRSAWAIVLGHYADTSDVCFGTSVSGRHAPVPGLENMVGPLVATAPVRICLDPRKTISDFLMDVQRQASEMVPHEQFGLQNIAKLSTSAHDACDFSSLLVVQPAQLLAAAEGADSILMSTTSEQTLDELLEGYFNYPLVIQIQVHDNQVVFNATYNSSILTEIEVNALSHHFERVIQQLSTNDQMTIGTISLTGQWDIEQAINRAGEKLEVINSCLHHLIESQALKQPDSPAIQAWDGDLSYAELNHAADKLAYHLISNHQVVTEDLIHVCFEKSIWFFVAILAINKAGCAWVPLDPSHPIQRQQEIVGQTGAKVALVSTKNAETCRSLGLDIVEVTADLHKTLKQYTQEESPLPHGSPHNAAYVLFTSGSTGIPKGLVMEHGSVCTSQTAISKRLGLTPEVRMLQFASYVFDLCIGEIFATLVSGGCLCVPSDEVRLESLPQFINEKDVNWAFLTPSFVRTIQPREVPKLKALLLAGEAVGQDILATWFEKLRLFNGWGPAETCVFSTIHEWKSLHESPLTIGKPVGGFCWVVDPKHPAELAPTGCIGEVIIQGPTLLREYLSDSKRTAEAIIKQLPQWIPDNIRTWGRLYKSGDLAFHNPNGTIEFVHRKDTQVKIRGLRIELGEIEHNIRSYLAGTRQVVVDILEVDSSMKLVAYLCFTKETRPSNNIGSAEDFFLPLTSQFKDQLLALIGSLGVKLPRYMIPAIFIPCRFMPTITSTKLDRNKLKLLMGHLSSAALSEYSLVNTEKRAPITMAEKDMQQLWSLILKTAPEKIGRDDSFLQLGGDSISAIQLVSLARQRGMKLTVSSIFDDPRLSQVASSIVPVDDESLVTTPFNLLPADRTDNILESARDQCQLTDQQRIEDAYPCTSLQEGLMALTVKQPGSYIAKYCYQIPDHIDIERFKHAWNLTVEACGNLRTRIIFIDGYSVQVLISDDVSWDSDAAPSSNSVPITMNEKNMTYGSRLCRYSIGHRDDGQTYFSLAIHHSVFDGWSMGLVRQQLHSFYYNVDAPKLQPYSQFINYILRQNLETSKAYWENELHGARRTVFPPDRSSTNKQMKSANRISQSTTKPIYFQQSETSTFTKATILRAAWAIMLSRYCDSDDICFGTSVSGRQAPVHGLETMAGPLVATVPVRVQVDSTKTVSEFLEDIQRQASNIVAHEQFGLQNIMKLNADLHEACDFSSLLVIQPSKLLDTAEGPDSLMLPVTADQAVADGMLEGYFSYPLVVHGHIYDHHVKFHAIYDSTILTETQIHGLSCHFDQIIQQLARQDKTPLSQISLVGPWDIELAIARRGNELEAIDSCIHRLFEEQANRHPNAVAIEAWDGQLTYAQLDNAANMLAHHLVESHSIVTEDLVHVCFEKSVWFFVAILAINKAGGAWVPLDPSHPLQRQQEVIRQTRSRIAITSEANADLCRSLGLTVVEVTSAVYEVLAQKHSQAPSMLPEISSRHAAYVLFTSGSTGTPKGLVMEHGSVCTSQSAIAERLGLDSQVSEVRMLQFASYVFDLCIGEIFATLISGGCLCVPSDETRLDGLARFIGERNINWAFLTPSFIHTLVPEEVPTLKSLLLAGEAVSQDTLKTWLPRVRLFNGWGPAETCVFSSIHEWQSSDNESPLTIGRPVAGHCWIVNPDDSRNLAPIGCIGEVLIQGPTLLREYLSDRKRTDDSMVTPLPHWVPQQAQEKQRWTRLYKSGDLAFYNTDGTMGFVGRKDNQIKIRGLRVELGEVEHSIRTALHNVQQVAVDTIRTDRGVNLVSYICFNRDTQTVERNISVDAEGIFLPLTNELQTQIVDLVGQLRVKLPRYMIPSTFIPCRYMPFITSTKLDRNTLQRLTTTLSVDEIAKYSLVNSEKRAPETTIEKQLQQLWASVLKISVESIGKDDSFLQLGGDSISAIQLVSLARDHGITLTVASIFKDARLSHLADTVVFQHDDNSLSAPLPFSLLPVQDLTGLLNQCRVQCQLSSDQVIEDAYPCTPLQEGLLALSIKQPGSYTATSVYKLSRRVDIEQFNRAWKETTAACAVLRTRIVFIEGKTIQIVIKEDHNTDDMLNNNATLEGALQEVKNLNMTYGSPLCHCSLVKGDDGYRYLVWAMHHSIFDGWTADLIMRKLQASYDSTEGPALQPYSRFIKHIVDLDPAAAGEYWTQQLAEAKRTDFPPRQQQLNCFNETENNGHTSQSLTKLISFSPSQASSITKATVLRAAWAIVLSRYCDSDDVCFGTSISGRHAPVPGLDAMAGPLVTTVPVRVRTEGRTKTVDFLRHVQEQASGMVDYEQFGLQNIARLSTDAREACNFSSLLVIQPARFLGSDSEEDPIMISAVQDQSINNEGLEGYFNYPLVIHARLDDKQVHFHAIYDKQILAKAQVTAISHHLDYVLQQLLTDQEKSLSELSLDGPYDIQQAITHKGDDPMVVDSCIHHIVERQALNQPNAPAIHAWDGKLTYAELNSAANRLARYLGSHGVVKEDLVHVCFEKSVWFFVSILAINKAGAAWAPLDPSHPMQRQKQVITQTKAKLALTSMENEDICVALGVQVITVTESLDAKLRCQSAASTQPTPAVDVSPRNAAYVLFTSGSTGTPKGVVIEHDSICTSMTIVAKRMRMTPHHRMLQFSSYVFDAFVLEAIATFIAGASVWVPSDHVRMNGLTNYIHENKLDCALLTPTYVRTITPEDIPSLKILIVGGEAVGQDILDSWFGKVRLINSWGPVETCVSSATHEWTSRAESPLTIGRPVGGYCWIVDPNDPYRLAPAGCVGEIMIQGPSLLREYLSNPTRTAESVIKPLPDWVPESARTKWGRFYKTGDLAFHNPEGRLIYVGRKDAQVKIRGLRVELEEVEHNIRIALDGVQQVAVDVLKTESGAVNLVSYLCFSKETVMAGREDPNSSKAEDIFLPLLKDLQRKIVALVGELSAKLPHYMIPTIFIPCRHMPFITSTKLDRLKLRRLTTLLNRDELAKYSLVDSEKRAPENARELELRDLWSKVLKIPADTIGRDDSFLRLGGDSISAIQLVSLARQAGLGLTVASIFDDARLAQVAARIETVSDDSAQATTEPFSLLPVTQIGDLLKQAEDQCALVSQDMIEDMFPCTPLQEGLMALSVKQPGSYMSRFTIELPQTLNASKFRAAMETTIRACPNLRTRIVQSSAGPLQIIVDESLTWQLPEDENHLLSDIICLPPTSVGYGTPLSFYTLANSTNSRTLVWDLHHSVYDAFTFDHMVRILQMACIEQEDTVLSPEPRSVNFSSYVKYLQSVQEVKAKEYWLAELEGARPMQFPQVPAKFASKVHSNGVLNRRLHIPSYLDTGVTVANLLRGAWALVLSRYLESEDVIFGSVVSGRSAPIPDIQDILGPTIATVPVRVRIGAMDTVMQFLAKVQESSNAMIPFEHTGLQNISRLGDVAREACDFKNQFIVYPASMHSAEEDNSPLDNAIVVRSLPDSSQNFDAYPLIVQCIVGEKGAVELQVTHDTRVIDNQQIQRICNHFEHALIQLVEKSSAKVSDISLCGPEDIKQVMQWNAKQAPKSFSTCFPSLLHQKVHEHPDKQAILACDGDFSYLELDELSTRLASYLSQRGLASEPEIMVPICFEKSKWAAVAMIAVMKAGAAFVPIDPSHPLDRRREVLQTVDATIIITSPETTLLCAGLALEMIVLSDELMKELPDISIRISSSSVHHCTPNSTAYVMFTSGSTGTPKGIVVDQTALCSSMMGHGNAYGLNSTSRVLQFSNFTFDSSLSELLTPLVFGGTVCMPSDTERLQDIAGYINNSQVTVAILTPSFANTISPDDVPSLDTLILSGEALVNHLKIWCGRVKLINAYGPSEVCIDCTTHQFQSIDESPNSIGLTYNSNSWIIEPDNHNQLTPIGCVGELLIQGPTLARGYLKNNEQTQASFLESVEWLQPSYSQHRFYKTGDLVKYNSDGTLEYIGRKDTQVKLRGQRLELGEIEHKVKIAQPCVEHAIIDVVRRDAHDILTAFISFSQGCDIVGNQEASSSDTNLLSLNSELRHTISQLVGDLRAVLPAYMVPTLLLPLREMPFNSSMKINRRGLKLLAADLPASEVESFSLASKDTTLPTTPAEFKLRELWAKILGKKPEDIGKNDSFLQIGGDSIRAIQLVSLARKDGLSLTVASIFKDSRLSHLAATAISTNSEVISQVTPSPFSLLAAERVDNLHKQARDQCGLASNQIIEDAYPCTPLQEGLMALSIKQPGSYTAASIHKLSMNIDIKRFKDAWNETVQRCVMLRTRIIFLDGQTIQVVVAEDACWDTTDGITTLDSAIEATLGLEMTYGSRLCRYGLATKGDDTYFIWTMHHSIFDGWTADLIRQQLHCLYYHLHAPLLQPYSRFIKYTLGLDHTASGKYWLEQLHDVKRLSFPPQQPQGTLNEESTRSDRSSTKSISLLRPVDSLITKATVIRAAWAIVLGRYSDTDDVCFGTSISGRYASVPDLETIAGPLVATFPVRIHLQRQQNITTFLHDIQMQGSNMVAHEQFGLHNIAKLSKDTREACDFSSLLIIQPSELITQSDGTNTADPLMVPTAVDHASAENLLQGYFNYPLVAHAHVGDKNMQLEVLYNSEILTDIQVEAFSNHFDYVVQQLLQNETASLGDISLAGPWDLSQVLAWNANVTSEGSNHCIHDLISSQTVNNPTNEAISAWDGNLTFLELDQLSTELAHHLRDCGVSLGVKVPICFEKSRWAIVAMLAIMKAGGAFIPLDPLHPTSRREALVRDLEADLIVVSNSTAPLCTNMTSRIIILSEELIAQLRMVKSPTHHLFSSVPASTAYILFTSGSTGTPKGIMVDHGAVCSNLLAHARVFGLCNTSRVLQFSNYAFDGAISEIFATLVFGGTVCIPSDNERLQHISRYINSARVNTAILTPSFTRTFSPEQVPTLEMLVFAGEAPIKSDLQTWHGHLRLYNGYGPTETCIFSTMYEYPTRNVSSTTIGQGFNQICWIVDQENHDRLAPIGCTGELIVQGRALASGYFKDEEKSKKSFLDNVAWLPTSVDTASIPRSFYKTGDLVKYRPDGMIEYIGRKDTQVKLRGQRLELGEIEHAIKMTLPNIEHAIVEIVGHHSQAALVAFFTFSGSQYNGDHDAGPLPMTEDMKGIIYQLSLNLRASLPPYMVPTHFLPLQKMPYISSMKIDRRSLREIANGLSTTRMSEYSPVQKDTVAPTSEEELRLQKLWAEVLDIRAEEIGKYDSFLEIGGDSISAIQLVSLARHHGIGLTVASIFKDSRLSHMATIMTSVDDDCSPEATVPPFSLLPAGQKESLLRQGQDQCGLSSSYIIEDAYPCTPLQEGLMALAVKQPGSYIAKYLYMIPDHIDIPRFRQAWNRTISVCGILRTRIVFIEGVSVQLLIHDDTHWASDIELPLDSITKLVHNVNMGYGSPLCHYGLATSKNNEQVYFALSIHHSVSDGWTMGLIWQQLYSFYSETEAFTLPPYSRFIKYIADSDHTISQRYWKKQLDQAKRAVFPSLQRYDTPSEATGRTSRSSKVTISLPTSDVSSITKATMLRSTWAIILARYCESDDICFGTSVSGRHAPVAGLDKMAGPLVTTIPVRIRLDRQVSIAKFLRDVQMQASNMIPHEQFGLQNIMKLSSEAHDACNFSSLLVIQPSQLLAAADGLDSIIVPLNSDKYQGSMDDLLEAYFNYPLVVQAETYENHVELDITYDTRVLTDIQIHTLSKHFEHVLQQLSAHSEAPLSQVSLVGPWDIEQAIARNTMDIDDTGACVHDLIQEQSCLHPNALALQAWDGTLTYSELDASATRLAFYLKAKGLEIEDLVHVCFEKSIWFFIAILAINKAGGAWVPLDPSHPTQRQQEVVSQTKAKLALTSKANAKLCRNIGLTVIEVTAALDKKLVEESGLVQGSLPVSDVSPKNAAYVLFTSGSTGAPKGLIMEHRSLCISQKDISKRLGLDSSVRMLQFASYVFDLSIGEIFATLISGGCLCIPSDEIRLNTLASFIQEMDINWAFLTPSFVKTLAPDQLPSLKALVLAGEAVSEDIVYAWLGKVRLFNGWGPAETCVFSALHEWKSLNESSLTIGKPVGGFCWIVDSENPQRLAPVGCVGEVIIQGPTLLRQYLSDSKKTNRSIMELLPDWVPQGLRERAGWGRLYKSGDLAFYNSDGTIEFVGRKDTQIKIRGLRVELGEIEHHIQVYLEGVQQVAVDVLKTDTGVNLVAYLCFSRDIKSIGQSGSGSTDVFLPMTKDLRDRVLVLVGQLGVKLPRYMIPTTFIPCGYMPTITSTKLDRSRLKSLTAELSKDNLMAYSLVGMDKRPPKTTMETEMQRLWASVLNLPVDSIGRDDNFLHLGGDSITAVEMVLLARKRGIDIWVSSIFEDARLSEVAAAANLQDDDSEDEE